MRHKYEPPSSTTERRQTAELLVTRMASFGHMVTNLKACKSRSLKRVAWVSALHADLHGAFDRLR